MRSFFHKYRSAFVYIIFGGLTTLVNYIVYFLLFNISSLSAALSNILAWIVAVLFAYLTDKPFVFESHDWSREVVIPEFLKFVGLRFVSGLGETALLFVLVDLLKYNGNIWKLVVSIFVVILNYVFSKFIVFNKK